MGIGKKYSLILMSDDNSIRSVRLGKKTIQFIGISFFVVPIIFCLCLWFTFQSIQKEQSTRTSYNMQQQELSELKIKVERLVSLNSMLEKYEKDYLANDKSVLTTAQLPTVDNKNGNGKNTNNLVSANTNDSAVANSSSNGTANGTAQSLESKQSTEAKKQQALANDQISQESVPVPDEEAGTSSGMDMNLAKLENIKVKSINDNSLQISFNLVNTGQKSQLEGNLSFYLLDSEENKVPLTYSPKDVSYRINRLKKVVLVAKYEQGKIKPEEHKVIVEVNNVPEGVILRQQLDIN